MKNLFLTGIILLLSLAVFAQTPAMFSYQAVIRNADSDLLVNEDVNLTVEILQTSFDGEVVFSEEHQTTTNAYGLVSVKIGSVNPLDGIDWGADTYFVRISVDDVIMGASQLLSVPYAMHAKTVDNMFSGNYSDLSGTPDLSNYITEIPEQGIGDLTDVDLNGLADNQILKYNAALGKWIAIDVAAASETDPEFNASPSAFITNAGSGMVITIEERAKLAGIELGAEQNVNSDWNAVSGDAQILNKPSLSSVALSGSYNDLVDVPTLFDGTWTSLSGKPTLASVATSGNYSDLNGLPVLFDGTWTSISGKPAFSTVATTGNYGDLNGLPTLFDGTWASLSGKPALSTVATSGNYNDLSNKPVTISPAQISAIDANTLKRSYPIADESKLAGIQTGAEVNVNPDWNAASGDAQIINKPILSALAISGNFSDISNKPTTLSGYGIIDAMSTSHIANSVTSTNMNNWNTAYAWGNHSGLYRSASWVPAWTDVTGKPSFATVATSGNYSDLSGRPSLATVATSGNYNDLSNKPSYATVATSGNYSDLSGRPTFATVATTGNYSDLAGKPILSTVATSGSYTDLVNLPTYSTVASSGNYSDLAGTPNLSGYATKNMNAENITNLANPVNDQDAATKSYSDMKFQMLLNYMVESGADIEDLLDAGVSIEELVEAEASIADLIAGGANVLDLFNWGVCVGTLRKAGALEADLIAAGLVGTLTDFEGNIYGWVKIGDQIWMDENLKSTKYWDGAEINTNLPYTYGYYIYENVPAYFEAYGYIYNFEAALRGEASTDANPGTMQGACPLGWHIPSNSEWQELKDFLINDGFGIDASNIGKAFASNTGWQSSTGVNAVGNDQALNNDSGFNALPSGNRNAYFGSFGGVSQWTYFYSSTHHYTGYPNYDNYVQTPQVVYNDSDMEIINLRLTGYPIRCVKN